MYILYIIICCSVTNHFSQLLFKLLFPGTDLHSIGLLINDYAECLMNDNNSSVLFVVSGQRIYRMSTKCTVLCRISDESDFDFVQTREINVGKQIVGILQRQLQFQCTVDVHGPLCFPASCRILCNLYGRHGRTVYIGGAMPQFLGGPNPSLHFPSLVPFFPLPLPSP